MSDYKRREKTVEDVGSGSVRHRVKERREQQQAVQQPQAAQTQPTNLQEAFPHAFSYAGSPQERNQSYWESPSKVSSWYQKTQADPTTPLPAGMDQQTLKGLYDYYKFRNDQVKISSPNLWRIDPDDPIRQYVQNIPAPTNDFMRDDEIKIWGQRDPKLLEPGGTSQQDYEAADFDWMRLTVEQKQSILKDPNFSIAKVTAPGQQGLVLSDSEFDLWGKARRGELQWWQPVAFSVLSNPKTSPLVQGAALTVMTRGKGLALAIPMTLLGYGAQSENEAIRVTSETLLKPFMWGAQTAEQLSGLGQYLSAGSRRVGHAAYTPEELAVVEERTQTFLDNPKEVFGAMKVFYETAGGDEVWVLGEGEKVQVKPGYTLEDAVKRALDGESSNAILADYAREYGINGVASDFLLQSVIDPLNVAPDVVSVGREKVAKGRAGKAATQAAKLAETPGISSVEKIAKLEARGRIEGAKAKVFESTPALTGYAFGSAGEAGRKFRALITGGAIDAADAKYMTKWERAVAGVTPEGKVRELLPSPFEGKVPKAIETSLTLQPKAKAKIFLEKYNSTIAGLFDWSRMTDATVDDIVRVVESTAKMDKQGLHDMGAEFMNSPEAYTVISAAGDAVPKIKDLVSTYHSADSNRQLFWQVQSILGDQPRKLLNNFLDGDARPDFQRLTETLKKVDTPEARALLAEIDAGTLTADTMKKMFEPFRDGGVAIAPEEFSANILNVMDDHMKTWGKGYFDLKNATVFDDSLRLLKGAQSLLLLDLSPSAMINDFLNERVMIATTGSVGLTPGKVIDTWVKDFGLTPKDAGYGLLGDLPVKETDVVSRITRGESAIGSVADKLNKARSYLLRPQASARFNQAHAKQIYYKQAKTYWSKQWRVGVGFERMPAALEGRLREYGLEPKTVYQNLQGVMSTKQLDTLNQRISTADVNSYVDTAAQKLGKDPAAVSSMLEELGVADDLRQSLSKAKTPEQRQAAFDAVENKVLENFDQRQAQELQGLLEQTRNKIKTEGPAGVIQTFHDISLDYFERKIENDNIWDDAYFRSEKTDNTAIRQSIKGEASRKNSAAWKRTQARQGALYQAAIDGLGLDTVFKRDFLGSLSEQHGLLRDFFTEKNKRYQEFFDTKFDSPEARSREWYNLEIEMNERFAETQGNVLKVQGDMNGLFTDEMARNYGDGARITSKMWTDGVLEQSTAMHEAVTSFRDSIKGITPEERAQAWDGFKPEYRKMWMERLRVDMEGSGQLYKWDQLPPEAMQAGVPADAAKFASIEEIANKYGVPTATDTGAPNPRQLLHIAKKYLGAEAADINTIKQLTPEMVERALQLREEVTKAREAGTLPSTEVAQDVRFDELDKTFDAAINKRKYTTQTKALNELNAEIQQLWSALPDDIDPVMLERLTELQNRVATELTGLQRDVSIAEGMTRAELDMKKSDAPVDTNAVQANLKKIKDAAKVEGKPTQEIFPPGGYDQYSGYVDYGKVLLDGFNNEVKPVMDAMKSAAAEPVREHSFAGMDADTQSQLNSWLTDVRSKMTSTKHQAKNYAEAQRDFAILDYNRQYGFDKALSAVVPYEFYGTRSAANWLTRVADRPAWISQYTRLMNLHNTFQSQLPERTRNKVFVPMPFLPEWAGGGMFIDPTFQAFPFKQFTQPLDAMRRENANLTNNAGYILQDMKDGGHITKAQYDEAIANQTGPIWERAMAQAEIERSENKNTPGDYFSMLLSPALYLTVPYYLATGKKGGQFGWPSGQLPITKFGQGLETAFKDTPLEFAGNIAGLLAKPEKMVREAKGLNEFGEWGEYYTERQVANMVAEGLIDSKQGNQALIEKQGDIWDQATQRVQEELMLKVPGMAPLYGLSHGATLDKVIGSAIPSLFPGGLLPPGEMEYKGLKQEYGLAWEAYQNGNKEAFTKFFDDHPEYQSRLALRKDPQERMTQFLKSEIWDAYGELGATDKKQATAFMGPGFQDFLSSEPGVEFSSEQLATWSKMLKGMVPQTPETQGVIEGQVPQIDYLSPETTRVTDKFFEDRKEKFPNYYNLQSSYYALPKSERGKFLNNFPELREYFQWKGDYQKKYPDLKPVFSGEVFKRMDTSNWPPSLLMITQQAALTGDKLSSGTKAILEQVWINEDRPYGSFDSWVYNSVYPSLRNQMMQEISQ